MLLREARARQSLKDKQEVSLRKGAEWKVSQAEDSTRSLSVLNGVPWAVLWELGWAQECWDAEGAEERSSRVDANWVRRGRSNHVLLMTTPGLGLWEGGWLLLRMAGAWGRLWDVSMEIYSFRQFEVQDKALAGSQVWGNSEMIATFMELVKKMVGPDHSMQQC